MSYSGRLLTDVGQQGADPTGVAYSDTAFVNALGAASTLPNNNNAGRVTVPAGTYKMGFSVRNYWQQMTIEGAGIGATTLVFDNDVSGVVQELMDAFCSGARMTLRNLTIKANGLGIGVSIGLDGRVGGMYLDNVDVVGFGLDDVSISSQNAKQGTQVTATITSGSNIVVLSAALTGNLNRFVNGLVVKGSFPFPAQGTVFPIGTKVASFNDTTHAVLSCTPAQVIANYTGTIVLNGAYTAANSNQTVNDEGATFNLRCTNAGRHGVYHQPGSDTDNWVHYAAQVNGNAGWGALDESFYGNSWIAANAIGNTIGSYADGGVGHNQWLGMFLACYSEGGQPTSFYAPTQINGGIFPSYNAASTDPNHNGGDALLNFNPRIWGKFSTAHNPVNYDRNLIYDCTSASLAITLPTLGGGEIVTIARSDTTHSGVNTLTVTPGGTGKINGQANKVLSDNQALTLAYLGSDNWAIVGGYTGTP